MKRIKIGQLGVNYVETIVNKNGYNFTKIDQENDIGIDGYIEIWKENRSTLVAVQIKCGESYYQSKKKYCKLPVGNHLEYWKNYKLPVYGIICNNDLTNAYFVNIKFYLDDIDDVAHNYIEFEKSEFLTFNEQNFISYFCNSINGEVPALTLEESLCYINSNISYDREIAFYNMRNKHILNKESGDKFLELLKTQSIDMNMLIYTFSRIFDNPDSIPVNLRDPDRAYVVRRLNQILNEKEIVNLLSYIQEEDGIERGTIGQCVECILNSLDKSEILLEIINNTSYEEYIRNCAVYIFAYGDSAKYEELYRKQLIIKTELNEMIYNYIKEYGGLYLY